MKIQTRIPRRPEAGSTLLYTVVFCGILALATYSLMQISGARARSARYRWDWNEAYYHAENALNWAVQRIVDQTAPKGQFAAADGTLTISYMTNLSAAPDTAFKNAWLAIVDHPSGTTNTYLVTASAQVGNKVRTLQSSVKKNPPSQIFDYEYFLNNWGWWWGSSITGYGDNRANWDFDFKDGPSVNGSIVAAGKISSNGQRINPLGSSVPLLGTAASDPVSYMHDGSDRLLMPNLKDFTYYTSQATNKGGTLYVGATLTVNAVQTNASQPGLYLTGTAASPIKINGPVVIPGDVVIQGVITGTGTLYVGGNLYVAGDVTYLNGPDFSTPPATMATASRDAWVQSSVSSKKDLVCFAVREAIYGGQVNNSAWQSACYTPSGYGLKNIGDESQLGADGIAGTPDDGIPYLDTNGDGKPDSAWFDADGDGIVDGNYNYTTQIQLDSTRAAKILNYPKSGTTPQDYNTLSTGNFSRLDGIFYTNHALAMYSTKSGMRINGSVISRDEAIIFSGSCTFVYDSRVHSRYMNDPNRLVDLGLPVANRVGMYHVTEVAPVAGFVTVPRL